MSAMWWWSALSKGPKSRSTVERAPSWILKKKKKLRKKKVSFFFSF